MLTNTMPVLLIIIAIHFGYRYLTVKKGKNIYLLLACISIYSMAFEIGVMKSSIWFFGVSITISLIMLIGFTRGK